MVVVMVNPKTSWRTLERILQNIAKVREHNLKSHLEAPSLLKSLQESSLNNVQPPEMILEWRGIRRLRRLRRLVVAAGCINSGRASDSIFCCCKSSALRRMNCLPVHRFCKQRASKQSFGGRAAAAGADRIDAGTAAAAAAALHS